MVCNEEEYFIIMKKKIGGVEQEFLKICLFENQVVQTLRCFGILGKSCDFMRYQNIKIVHAILHVIVEDFSSLQIMYLCNMLRQKMVLRSLLIKI